MQLEYSDLAKKETKSYASFGGDESKVNDADCAGAESEDDVATIKDLVEDGGNYMCEVVKYEYIDKVATAVEVYSDNKVISHDDSVIQDEGKDQQEKAIINIALVQTWLWDLGEFVARDEGKIEFDAGPQVQICGSKSQGVSYIYYNIEVSATVLQLSNLVTMRPSNTSFLSEAQRQIYTLITEDVTTTLEIERDSTMYIDVDLGEQDGVCFMVRDDGFNNTASDHRGHLVQRRSGFQAYE
ncbi:unnamed protein product [Dovyalis caffra]|uniref:Uncharacterized protein n=1 Tax=Dovyalis caffra TaxID=77055 RepID=A0AAV1QMV1_9ROSI|nr:unnamed protein product [Dovyalis caffra]